MEEIVTIDGRQFKLTTDRQLTASEKAQVIADIRKQTGCSSCHQPRVVGMGNDWQYGGIRHLAKTCTPTAKGTGDTVTVSSIPTLGVGPYTIEFYKAPYNSTNNDTDYAVGTLLDLASISAGIGGRLLPKGVPVTGTISPDPSTNPTGTIAEGNGISYDYLLDDADIAGATIKGADATATMIFAVLVTDSCPAASGGPKYCLDVCKVSVTCIPPTCNFIVS